MIQTRPSSMKPIMIGLNHTGLGASSRATGSTVGSSPLLDRAMHTSLSVGPVFADFLGAPPSLSRRNVWVSGVATRRLRRPKSWADNPDAPEAHAGNRTEATSRRSAPDG